MVTTQMPVVAIVLIVFISKSCIKSFTSNTNENNNNIIVTTATNAYTESNKDKTNPSSPQFRYFIHMHLNFFPVYT